jgi:hypothetical protein
MKYIVGASIGGLFGLGVPLMLDAQEIESANDSRQEEFQPVEEESPIPIENKLILPDEFCGHIKYESTNPKEQAKECINRSIVAVPAI